MHGLSMVNRWQPRSRQLLAFRNTIHRETTEKEANKSLIEQVMGEVFGSPKSLFTLMRADWEGMQKQEVPTQDLSCHKSKK